MNAQIVLIDNFDSFTYNLVDQFRSLGYPVTIYRNSINADAIVEAISKLANPVVVLSPGPGAPSDAGCMPALIQKLKGKVPMLGICLGHQALVEAYGGVVAGAGEIVHGKSSQMSLGEGENRHEVFAGLPNPLCIARYHSLVATKVTDELDVIADVDGLAMAVVNNSDKVVGYQFHPESILTTHGADLLVNTIDWILKTGTGKSGS